MVGCNPSHSPADPSVKLSRSQCPTSVEDVASMRDRTQLYQKLVGMVLYLAICTRPDISFAVGQLAKFVSNPGEAHWTQLTHLIRYISATRALGIRYLCKECLRSHGVEANTLEWHSQAGGTAAPGPNVLEAYVDSDWARDADDRRSVSGCLLMCNGGPISWRSKTQHAVA